jgi:uncharacterized protein YndB with AHSA1/START domain
MPVRSLTLPSVARLLAATLTIALAIAGSLSTPRSASAQPPPAVDHMTQGAVEVTLTRAPEKRLDFVVVVPANLDQVWQAMTTSEGLSTWLWAVSKVDLRLGGAWEADFPGGKTAGGNILSFLPQEMLALSAMAPEEFPTVRRERTQAVFFFESVDPTHTRIRLSQIGWKSGDEWDRAFAYLAKGNARLLNALQRRFASGPTDWQAMMRQK